MEIAESGTIKQGEKINLGFEISGIVKKIFVKNGQEVKENEILVEIDNTAILAQLNQAKANFSSAKSQFEKLMNGASKEEIILAQIAVENAKTALENTEKNSKESLNSAYYASVAHLQDAKEKTLNALLFIRELQRSYFLAPSQLSLKILEIIDNLDKIYQKMADNFSKINESSEPKIVDDYLEQFRNDIFSIKNDLETIKIITETQIYRAADKTTLDAHRAYLSVSYSNILADISAILVAKTANSKAIDAAYYGLKQAQATLNKLIAPPRKEDINHYQSQVLKTSAELTALENQLNKTQIKSPQKGIILEISKQKGELAQALSPIISFMPSNPYYIEADIYEEDIPKIKIGDRVECELLAYADQILEGEVLFIEPKEKVINEVVYYPVKIFLKSQELNLYSGMSADVAIIISRKENVLVVSENALIEENGKYYLLIKDKNKMLKKEVNVGLIGTNGLAEIKDGFKEGDVVFSK